MSSPCGGSLSAAPTGRLPEMDHPWFVAAAYGISAIVIAGLICWILLDGRARQRDIAALEASGIRRRSARDGGGQE